MKVEDNNLGKKDKSPKRRSLKKSAHPSLKKRIIRTFSLLNFASLLVMLALITFFVSYSFHAFTSMLSESVAGQMANALSLRPDMPLGSLSEPYRLSSINLEDPVNKPMNLIHYVVKKNGQVVYDSISQTAEDAELSKVISELTLMKKVNVKSVKSFNDVNDKVAGTFEVELNPILVYIVFMMLLFITILGFLMVLFFTQLATRFFGSVVIKPLAELEKKMSDMASGDIEAALHTTITFKKPVLEVEQLSNHANNILSRMNDYVDDLENQKIRISEQMQKINTIFQQVDQGIMQIGKDHLVQDAYSKECERLFGNNIATCSFVELLYPERVGEQKFISELLSKVFESTDMAREVYMSLLPNELQIKENWVRIDYKMLQNTSEHLVLMIILTDLTEKKHLEKQMQNEQKTLRMVVKAMIHAEELRQLMLAYSTFASEAIDLYGHKEWIYLTREIHTFKGSFSQYDWQELVDYLDQLENELLIDPEQFDERKLSESALLAVMAFDLEVIRSHAGSGFLKETTHYLVEKDKIMKVENRVKELLSTEECREILPMIRELRYVPLKQLLSHYVDYVQKLSERLGKSVAPMVISGDDVRVDPDYFGEVLRYFVHLFRNSVDHGIETDEERVAADKPLEAQISVIIHNEPEQIVLIVRDDGKGIDMERLIENSKEDGLGVLDDLNLIFKDGVTSKLKATQISGKGVGLSALKEAVESAQGHISVTSLKNIGTEFTIIIPKPSSLNDLTTPEEFMSGICETVNELLVHQYQLNQTNLRSVIDNQIVLDEMTAIVNLKGTMNLIVMMSVNRKLLHRLAKDMIFYDLADVDPQEYEEDLLGEFSNTLIGNSLRDFDHREDIFHLGIPVIMTHSEGYIKYSQDLIRSRYFEFDEQRLSMHLIPIHSEYIVKRLKED